MTNLLVLTTLILQLASLLFCIISTYTNHWVVDGKREFGLFEDCMDDVCEYIRFEGRTQLVSAFMIASILLWNSAFVCLITRLYVRNKRLELGSALSSAFATSIIMIACLIYTVEHQEQLIATQAHWGYSYIMAWTSDATGAMASVLSTYAYFSEDFVQNFKPKPPELRMDA